MKCPKCDFEQPDGLIDCMRCGVIFSRLRGLTLAADPLPASAAPAAAPIPPIPPKPPTPAAAPQWTPPGAEEIIPLAPATETLYDGPPPAARPQQMFGDPGGIVPRAHHTFDLGSALSETFSIYFSNLFAFLLLTGVTFAPVFVATAFASAPSSREEKALALLLALALQMVCTPLATAAVSFGVFQQMRHRDTTILECLKIGLGSLLTVLFVAILQGLSIFIGMLLCFIPGLILLAMYAVAVPAAVEERLSPFAALTRSGQLTDGYRWPIFCVLFVLGLLGNGAKIGAATLAAGLFPENQGAAGLLELLATVVVSGLSATAAAVMYYRLRSAKESIDVENIASVFD